MIPHFKGNLPFISPDQMMKVERIMTEDYGISMIQIMENAGRNLAALARDKFIGNVPKGKKVIVIAGPGGNGGGAMVAARMLKNWGADVSILLTDPKGKFRQETVFQFSICQKMKIPIVESIGKADLIIDGIKGFSFQGNPTKNEAKVINMVNSSNIAVLAFDSPSGLDLSTGRPGEPTIKADATMALAIPKFGLFRQKASAHIGELFLADISTPPEIYKSLKIDVGNIANVFAENPVVKINKVIVFS
ncbi:MAG: NAD(P)H-hydrate epimerase [Bacteroidetes bacterium]|nr:NAD(P)H-hydrate epimerase [Bacteroidota bacterium]